VNFYYTLLKESGYPGFLISAYDVFHNENRNAIINDFNNVTDNSNTFTLMDSGNYEAFWHKDKEWSEDKFESILKDIRSDICFSYDVFYKKESIKEYSRKTALLTLKAASMQAFGTTVPIIHGTKENIPEIVKGVTDEIFPEIIGFAEKDLGSSLLERAHTIKTIRDVIDRKTDDVPIHILGTGNPTSLMLYSLCGADLFDGLEWCKNAISSSNAHVYHFVQRELFECDCEACAAEKNVYARAAMLHNLIFYDNFLSEIRAALAEGDINELVSKYLPKHIQAKIIEMVG
jgi:tRNA-guanine family transglycosylase